MLDDARLHLRMFIEIEIQSIGEGVHKGFQPRGARGILRLHIFGINEELHAQVLINFGFAFGLGESAHRIDVICLDAIEVVLGLRVLHTEDGVGIGFSVNVGEAPIVTDNGDLLRFFFPACDVGAWT
jgi:hypothetical protein